MPELTGPEAYLHAVERQVEIARYHLGQLRKALDQTEPSGPAEPPIPVQAHFEGVVVSTMAAVDKLAQAVNSAFRLQLGQGELVQRAFAHIGGLVPAVATWFSEPIGRDLRQIRARMVHYAYAKQPGRPTWRVEDAQNNYGGPRTLDEYATQASEYASRLKSLLPEIRDAIRARSET